MEPLTPAEVKTIHPNWNPDSKSIAYCTDDDLKPPKKNPAEIYSIEIASRKIVKLIGDGGVNTYPALVSGREEDCLSSDAGREQL